MMYSEARLRQWSFLIAAQDADCDQCILWPFGKMGRGYGSVMNLDTGRVMGAHRVACERANGKPPTPKHHAAHRCGNPGCINPKHLRWATARENAADKRLHGTDNNGERHGIASLTNRQAAEIRRRLRHAVRGDQRRIADEYGVSPMVVSQVARGASYRVG